MGETCGMRLVNETISSPTKCKYCEKIDTKIRKRQAEFERIVRWQREGRNPASIEKAQDAVKQLEMEIQALWGEVAQRRNALGGQRAAQQYAGYY